MRVQFVRAISPSTSYAPAVVELAKQCGWKRVCTLAYKSPDFVGTVTVWTKALVETSINVRNIFLDEQGLRRVGSLSSTLTTIESDRLRVLIVLASPDVVKQVALAADSMGLVDSGWAWISDSVVGKIDFKGDTPEVCADESFVAPLPRFSQQAGREPVCCHPSMRRRRPLRDAHSTGGCT